MDLAASLLTFTMFWKLSYSLQCYTCCPDPRLSKDTEPCPCTQFDFSDKHLVTCEQSTMCFKRITTLEFGDGLTSKSIARGCAPQTTKGEQRKTDGKWHPVTDIYEAYEESCSEDPSNGERTTKTTHCYCRGDRCNGANKIFRNTLAVATMAVILCCLS
ncbi:hypothetical protein PYW08_008270 [Mythimna loreyi]|uniref:Uncharacterized protein n=1 Tax=Mythimna loreyi TaxID=667449 RepID=A0ACC2QB27_9NEOP|nr:hypothetical protein PYW08_008270 [Mythimna loreyi]